MSDFSWSKWNKHLVLGKCAGLVNYLPETRRLNSKELRRLLEKYDKVIIKPSASFGGSGVMQVSSRENGRYELHSGTKVKSFADLSSLSAYLESKRFRNYIVQRRISLAKVNDRPFDLRVMVQRRKNSDWTVTGKLAKIAGKGYIVTNIRRSNGSVTTVENAILRSNIKSSYSESFMSQIDKVALRAAKHLHKYYKWIRVTGIDMGLDRDGRIWIIEANFDPAASLFRKLKDKSMYRRILSYKK